MRRLTWSFGTFAAFSFFFSDMLFDPPQTSAGRGWTPSHEMVINGSGPRSVNSGFCVTTSGFKSGVLVLRSLPEILSFRIPFFLFQSTPGFNSEVTRFETTTASPPHPIQQPISQRPSSFGGLTPLLSPFPMVGQKIYRDDSVP